MSTLCKSHAQLVRIHATFAMHYTGYTIQKKLSVHPIYFYIKSLELMPDFKAYHKFLVIWNIHKVE